MQAREELGPNGVVQDARALFDCPAKSCPLTALHTYWLSFALDRPSGLRMFTLSPDGFSPAPIDRIVGAAGADALENPGPGTFI